ncbi:hypothetical protein PIB30_057576 [Stylosanthes scabra]|uniref:Uncharacterized protein n=1 Tax=Stylosanthes scabra TaxID=79078 RepID=A0ABU6RJU8_9FABA|nr:hypothetical protein [Stylosanthes scabra]
MEDIPIPILRVANWIGKVLVTEFSTNLEQATQQAQEEGDDSAGTIDPNSVWRQTLSESCWNRVYGDSEFFASSLHRSGLGGSSASAASTYRGLDAPEVVDLREQMSRQMAAFYNPLRPGSSATVGGSGSSTAPPLPRRPPPRQPDHPLVDDDDDYEDV